MTVKLGHWPFLVSFCVPVPGVQSTKTNGHYNSFHFHNFHDFPKMAVSWFYAVHQQCLCVWPKLRVQMQRQNESLRRYYSFNLTNVKRKTSFTGLNKTLLDPNDLLDRLALVSVCVTWAQILLFPQMSTFNQLLGSRGQLCTKWQAAMHCSNELALLKNQSDLEWEDKAFIDKYHLHQFSSISSHRE